MVTTVIMEIEKHYKLSEAAPLLSVSTRTLRRWIKDKRINAVMWDSDRGQEYRIPVSELVKFGFVPEKEKD